MCKGDEMNFIKYVLVVLLLQSLTLEAKESIQIHYNLENPFRFFKDPKIYWEMKKIYDNLNVHNISEEKSNKGFALERALQTKMSIKYKGWAEHFASNWNQTTYWNQYKMMYQKNYINPKSYNIEVYLSGVSKEDKCEWSFDGTSISNVPCYKKTLLRIPANQKIILKYKIEGKNIEDEKEIEIKDKLIVGLGDSYGSGEGNPDTPASFKEDRSNYDFWFVKGRYYPRKDTNNPAKWIDRRCHRSLYSYQFKTALQYSLEHPKEFVTFVSFSCSGATSEDILTKYKSAVEHLKNITPTYDNSPSALEILEGKEDKSIDRRSHIRPQIKLLKDTIKNQKIDILLLSIGGNDIGFAKYVKNVLLKTGSKEPTEETEHRLRTTLSENYYRLDKALRVMVKNKDAKRIFLSVYPEVLYDENANLCKGDRQSFDNPFGVTEKRKERLIATDKYLTKPLYQIQKELAHEIGWTLVDEHRDKFKKHGFCAKNPNYPESFMIPHKLTKEDPWIPYSPVDTRYKAYREKQRWMQIPVDSTLMINLTQKILWLETDFFISDETSGIMHPSADGLAVEADANYQAIQKFLESKK
jgi:hypothetical protein